VLAKARAAGDDDSTPGFDNRFCLVGKHSASKGDLGAEFWHVPNQSMLRKHAVEKFMLTQQNGQE
jgi:hypothetical protein